MSPKKVTQKSAKSATKKVAKKAAKSTSAIGKGSKGFSAEEKAAMKALLKERKAAASKAEAESAALAAIAEMQEPDRSMAKRFHAIVKASAPTLSAKTWYGMPAYADDDGDIVCFFQSSQKFKTRYSTFGFSDKAKLDEGGIWPTGFALAKLTAAEEAKIAALVKKAVS
jgi:uncharacterized protein YdhG (YjbR/CyaY superfamily)